MGSKGTKDLQKEDYQGCCEAIKDFLSGQIKGLKVEDTKDDIMEKLDKKIKKATVFIFIKNLLEKEKKEKIFNKMIDIFQSLYEQFEQIHRKENDDVKTFKETADDNDKNIINAIFISNIFDSEIDDDAKIHDYAVYLYGEDAVKEIEDGKNKNIDEDFKNFFDDNFEPTDEEKNKKFNEFCKEKNIDPKKYDKQESTSSQNDGDDSENKNKENLNSQKDDKTPKKTNKKENKYEHDENLNKNKYSDDNLLEYYDVIFNIDSLENLKTNGWQLEFSEKGKETYEKRKNEKSTVVSVIGNKNKGKSFILTKLSNIEIPDGFNITTKGLSIIYPKIENKNIIFLDTAGFEIPLCENEEFKFTTDNKQYKELEEQMSKEDKEKDKFSIKNYLTEEEYITQTIKFTRDRQNTDYFLQKFILNSADILLCIVNQLNLSDHKFLNRIQEENKDKKIFVIHNLKTIKKKDDVKNYIDDCLLKLVTSKLEEGTYIEIPGEKKKEKEHNNLYYRQVFEKEEDNNSREVIHLFMANDKSEAGEFYNDSTLEFIKFQIINFTNLKSFPIIDKVKQFLFDHSEEFFNDPLEKIEDLKEINENDNSYLKYTNKEKPYELKECLVDELGNANFIQSNYKPSYRAYKVKYKDEKSGESIKLVIDIEISGEIKDVNDLYPKKDNKNGQNIITISGKRELKKIKTKSFIADNKSNYFDNENSMFNLRIYIPNEQGIIEKLYKRQFDENKGLYRFIYNIKEKNDEININVFEEVEDDEDEDEYEDEDDDDKKSKEKNN